MTGFTLSQFIFKTIWFRMSRWQKRYINFLMNFTRKFLNKGGETRKIKVTRKSRRNVIPWIFFETNMNYFRDGAKIEYSTFENRKNNRRYLFYKSCTYDVFLKLLQRTYPILFFGMYHRFLKYCPNEKYFGLVKPFQWRIRLFQLMGET